MCMSNVSYRFLSDERVDSCYLRTKGEHTRKQNDRRGRKRAGGGEGERRGGKEEETRELGQQEGARLAWNSRFARSRKEGKG